MEIEICGYLVKIDDEDKELFNKYKWFINIGNRMKPYLVTTSHPNLYFHKLVMKIGKDFICDHKNGDSLDNRKENLRKATRSQNAQNSRRRRDNSSGIKGVCFDSRDKVWRAFIQANGKRISLGSFKDIYSAQCKYIEASEILHGEFHRVG